MKSALLLKRRIQLFASDLLPAMKAGLYDYLNKEFEGFNLPRGDVDITGLVKDKPVPQADTLVLFSSRSTSNKGRKRFKHIGQTASIYRCESMGGGQIGTLINVTAIKQGPVFYHSIPNQRAETVNPIIRSLIPSHSAIFTDMGYSSLGRNHRRVNHSLKSKDKRYRFSRERWSKNGIHCQAAESQNNKIKRAFKNYVYIRPQYSQLYLNEYSFIGNLKYYNLEELSIEKGRDIRQTNNAYRRGMRDKYQKNRGGRGSNPRPHA